MKQPPQCKRGNRLAERAVRASTNVHILPTATAKARNNWANHFRRCKKCQRWHDYKDRQFGIERGL